MRAVRELDRLVERVVRRDTVQTGPKTSSHADPCVGRGARDHRRPDQAVAGRASPPVSTSPPDCLAIHSSTRSRSSVSISGPTSVVLVGRVADHERLDLRQEARDEVVVDAALRRRCAARRCSSGPANENAFAASRAAASSTSASASTITGVALPSSSVDLLAGRALASASSRPRREPVNVIAATRSSSTRTSPISADGPTTTFSQPGGSPASCSSSASRSAESGVWPTPASARPRSRRRAPARSCARPG